MRKILYLITCLFFCLQLQAQTERYNLLIGTYTRTGKSEGIYVYDFNLKDASASLKSIAKNVSDPTYLALSPDKKFVYSVNGNTNSISAFTFDKVSGKLNFLNRQDSNGAGPCYITADDKHVIVANYAGGSLAVYSRNAGGSLTEARQVIQHTGKSTDPGKRQESAHVHMVKFTPDHRYLICNDLGEDQTYIYSYNSGNVNHPLSIKGIVKTNAGTGPRQLSFSPNGKFAYLVHEFSGGITAFTYANGKLNKIQEVGTTDKDFKGKVDGADIRISPDGKFLYESNRGDANAISIFSIFPTGRLVFKERVSTLGKGPRYFEIDPKGNYLLVGHQYTNDVVIFKINKTTGTLTDTGKRINVGAPVCLIFTPVN